jgi:hypothetical protein
MSKKMYHYTCNYLLQEAYDIVEHVEIYKLVKEREKTPIEEYIPLDQVLKENGLL